MDPTVSVSLSPPTLRRLMEHLRATDAAVDLAATIDLAICFWLTAMSGKQADENDLGPRGYQWKSLFLPEGTLLRMTYSGDHAYAVVKGDQILYHGRPVSPNQFASLQADSVRNAWHDLSVRMPGEKHWTRAFLLRRELQQRAAMSQDQRPAAAPLAPVVPAPKPAVPLVLATPRDPTPGAGWTEPERRKYRFRLEDVAFD